MGLNRQTAQARLYAVLSFPISKIEKQRRIPTCFCSSYFALTKDARSAQKDLVVPRQGFASMMEIFASKRKEEDSFVF